MTFAQNAHIIFHSKRQNAVESSALGSEFVAMKIAKEMTAALHFKVRMFGAPINGPANASCDNQGTVKNMSMPKLVSNKKHVSIACHSVCKAAAASML